MTVTVVSLTPMLARLRVTLPPGEASARVVGPRRPGHATVEVSYPMRVAASSDAALTLEVSIPEPNRAPFEYRVVVTSGGATATRVVTL